MLESYLYYYLFIYIPYAAKKEKINLRRLNFKGQGGIDELEKHKG
jgi:hypothetical protein